MVGLLGEMDSNVVSGRYIPLVKPVKSESRRKVRVLSPPLETLPRSRASKASESVTLQTPPDETSFAIDDDDILPPLDDDDIVMSDPVPSSPTAKAAERKSNAAVKMEEDDDEDIMEVSQAVADYSVKGVSVNISGARPPPKIRKEASYPTPESSSPTRPPATSVDPSSWNDVTAKLNVLSSSAETSTYGKVRSEDAMESDGSVRMFWTDYTEVNGNLCLFGKVKDKKSGSFVSTFVKVDNILRKLFFLPRTHRKSKCNQSAHLPLLMKHRERTRHQ